MNITSKSREINGATLILETGRFAQQASAAVMARYGDTMVLATVTASQKETSLDYFPLSVEYVERLYAGGRIKGSRWVKREGRPSDDAILTARVIDRSIRPLFPKNYKHDVQVVVTVLSIDGENDPDVIGLVAVSAALRISHIPWNGPIGGVRIGSVSGMDGDKNTFLVNPTISQQAMSDFDLIVSSTKEKVVMIEGGFCETPEKTVEQAVVHAKKENSNIIELIEDFASGIDIHKGAISDINPQTDLQKKIRSEYVKDLKETYGKVVTKEVPSGEIGVLAERIAEQMGNDYSIKDISSAIDSVFMQFVREDILKKKKRIDGRALGEIRPLSAGVGILPRTHGSAVFTRGITQALTVATLGTPSLEQLIESPMGEESKRYIHHYSMPPYSVGETGRIGYPSRREVGHGALAERALLAVIPSEEEFPYTIRLVSEILSSNGSTSMAATCGSTLALMDAGVPIKSPVSGISIGLVCAEDGTYTLLTDIAGYEDFAGDMDFKVAGTADGITAIQLDVKIDGLTDQMISETLLCAKSARKKILDTMLATISEPRKKISAYAPKVHVLSVPVEKIGEVIGPGGRTIRAIIASTGAAVDVEDDGSVMISGTNEDSVMKAVEWVEGLTREVQPDEEYDGIVKRIMPFGAFVEILPGKEGMVHVSELSGEYVKDPSEVVSVGDKVHVRVLEIDDQRRINLSMRSKDDKRERQPRKDMGRGRIHQRSFGPKRRFK